MSEPTIERGDGGPDAYRCDSCGTVYTLDKLNPIQSFAERVESGAEVPAGECPDDDCGALCYPVEIEGERWTIDAIQFPRLLAELMGVGLTNKQYADLSEAMDLTRDEIDELFDRADAAWQKAKAEI